MLISLPRPCMVIDLFLLALPTFLIAISRAHEVNIRRASMQNVDYVFIFLC